LLKATHKLTVIFFINNTQRKWQKSSTGAWFQIECVDVVCPGFQLFTSSIAGLEETYTLHRVSQIFYWCNTLAEGNAMVGTQG
jgi:hypothetical protein